VNDQYVGLQTLILAIQTLIFLLQLLVFSAQAKRLRQTVEAAKEQSGDMKLSIAEATRSANAMETSSRGVTIASQAATESVANTKEMMTRLLRAYVCANFGDATFQNPSTGFRLQARLLLSNAGQTPAYSVGFKARADVLPFPLPPDFNFEVPEDPAGSQTTLGGHQPPITLTLVVDRLYSEEEIAELRSGSKRLYLFGTITYDDVYRVARYTNFSFSVVWLNEGKTMGLFTRRHNDAE
jgi:hypothetical protein